MQVPVGALESSVALYLIGDNNRWRPASFSLIFHAGVGPETDPHSDHEAVAELKLREQKQ